MCPSSADVIDLDASVRIEYPPCGSESLIPDARKISPKEFVFSDVSIGGISTSALSTSARLRATIKNENYRIVEGLAAKRNGHGNAEEGRLLDNPWFARQHRGLNTSHVDPAFWVSWL
ncbi:hypothetical protein PILCRDRAFT_707681 [Piloderma croceum F 1598]|uniref:Uncharacterized protein n=1 Tax=Piloderma croceum (strain F 1598) TaxID=765440 RepID=A0A0C3EP32_PILCF|nr:hypothetical protein PILCRDRAFT_707681 [Piloderma croceum F 1598]